MVRFLDGAAMLLHKFAAKLDQHELIETAWHKRYLDFAIADGHNTIERVRKLIKKCSIKIQELHKRITQ